MPVTEITSDPWLWPGLVGIAEDLDHLRLSWGPGASNTEIRRGTAILRRFLVDGGSGILLHAWRRMGFQDQPTIVAPDLFAAVGRRYEGIVGALAGGGNFDGSYAANMVLNKGPKSRSPRLEDEGKTAERPWRLTDFVDAPSAIIQEAPVKRREVIQFYANYLGGVHLLPTVKEKDRQLSARIRIIRGLFQAFVTDGLHFEVLSIGQAIGKSEDLRELSERIKALSGQGLGPEHGT